MTELFCRAHCSVIVFRPLLYAGEVFLFWMDNRIPHTETKKIIHRDKILRKTRGALDELLLNSQKMVLKLVEYSF